MRMYALEKKLQSGVGCSLDCGRERLPLTSVTPSCRKHWGWGGRQPLGTEEPVAVMSPGANGL